MENDISTAGIDLVEFLLRTFRDAHYVAGGIAHLRGDLSPCERIEVIVAHDALFERAQGGERALEFRLEGERSVCLLPIHKNQFVHADEGIEHTVAARGGLDVLRAVGGHAGR